MPLWFSRNETLKLEGKQKQYALGSRQIFEKFKKILLR